MVEKVACLLGPLDGTDSAVAVHCPGEGPAPPGAERDWGPHAGIVAGSQWVWWPAAAGGHGAAWHGVDRIGEQWHRGLGG